MMPGDLIQGHVKYKTECNRCHNKLEKGKQTTLCLACHKKVAADVKKKEGYHGKVKRIATDECRSCHSDHLGEDADVVNLDKDTFNHDNTDFKLIDRHQGLSCKACHKPKKKYREAPSLCLDCHKKDDPHNKRLGKKCEKCHTVKTWSKTKFKHDKTKFKLKGKHKKIDCKACHVNQRYKDTPKICYDCHKLDDVHKHDWGKKWDKKCEKCHTDADTKKKWGLVKFDHNKTKYKLKGKHKKAACLTCHKGKKKLKAKAICHDCHKDDDEHLGRYGKKCKECHTPKSWKKEKFNHKDTDFPLKGKHKKTPCRACHKGEVKDVELATDCYACHRHDDVHKSKEKDNNRLCQRCHNEKDWGDRVVFNHDITHFPLIGLHAIAPCEECHVTAVFTEAKSDCIACHKGDDEHKERLGKQCHQCHTPNDWALWNFDHDTESDYKLDGKHKGLACLACHTKPVTKEIKLSTRCKDCHQRDDTHAGSFGQACEQCHTTADFDKVQISR